MRVAIIGNSGAGKSTLARQLAGDGGVAVLDLDLVFWRPGEAVERPREERIADVQRFCRENPSWVIEGCYADLIEATFPWDPELIFLDPGREACVANCRRRPHEPHKYPSKEEQDEGLGRLLDWVEGYYVRDGLMSHAGHTGLFDRYRGTKRRMTGQGRSAPCWEYDEFKSVGRDYSSQAEVDVYDPSHADFRDIRAESNRVLDLLGIAGGESVIDFGSGTGTFAIEAARRGARVHAVDVSEAMLARSKEKAVGAGVSGIEFHHAGFLSYRHQGGAVDAVVSTFALHHLPDFWKGVALQRISELVRPGGQFYLHDVILSERGALENIARFIEAQEEAGGAFLREDAEGHFRDEYSTYDWVIDGLLSRAGFRIVQKWFEGGVLGSYLCARD